MAVILAASASSLTAFAAMTNQESTTNSVSQTNEDTGKIFTEGLSKALFNTISGIGKHVSKDSALIGGFLQVYSVFGSAICGASLEGEPAVTTKDLIDNINKLSENLEQYHVENMSNMQAISLDLKEYQLH